MALPATANFNGTDSTELNAHNANFTAVTGAMALWSNCLAPNTPTNECCYRWTADAFNNDQKSQITISTDQENSSFVGVSVRCQNGSVGYYAYYHDLNDRYFLKMVGGTYSDLVSPQTGVTNNIGDILRIEAEGTTIRAYLNGSLDGSFSTTDNSHASGEAGVAGWGELTGTNNDTLGDNWTADNFSAAATLPRMALLGVG